MRKYAPLLLAFLFLSCGKSNWSKKYVYDDCMKEMKKDKQAADLFTNDQMEKICDCSADKSFKKYKSEADANKDQQGLMEIGKECAMEVLSK